MKLKVRSGTADDHKKNLCLSCQHAIIREDEKNNVTIRCRSFGMFVASRTIECNSYDEKNTTSFIEMSQIAWTITPGTQHRQVGFKPIKELSPEEKEKFDEEIPWEDI